MNRGDVTRSCKGTCGAPKQELEMLMFVSHDSNVVQFFGACILEGCPVLVLECMKVCSPRKRQLAPLSDTVCPSQSEVPALGSF